MARRRKTETVGDVTGRFMQRIDPEGKRHTGSVVNAWKQAAGDEVSRHTSGVVFKNGELVVSVDSPAWANELSLMTDRFRKALNDQIGQNLVRSIRFTVSRRVSLEQKEAAAREETEEFYEADATPPSPLSQSELDQATYMAAAVPDEKLRRAALRVMIKDLEWKKGGRSRKTPQAASEGPTRDDLGC
ncbi:MAG: DciA family protein [Coriobacteriia bacterium]